MKKSSRKSVMAICFDTRKRVLLLATLFSMVANYSLGQVDYADASDDNPIDMTSFIVNADYASTDGWEGSKPTLGYGNAEFWNVTYNTHQTITNLPNGIYKLGIQGFYRAGSWTEAYDAYVAGNNEALIAKMYARTSSAFYCQPFCSIIEGSSDKIMYSNNEEFLLDNGRYIPNSMVSSAAYFDAGYYNENSLYLEVTDGTLTIGIAKTNFVGNDWNMFGNWSLTYYGENSAHTPVESNDSLGSIYNAMVTESDADIEFDTDDLYPWVVTGAEVKNGNCGNRYSSSYITMAYKSDKKTELSFDWLCYNYSNHQPLRLYIDGVLKTTTSNSSYTNKRYFLEPGEHVITFKDSIGNNTNTNNYSFVKNVKVKEIKPLESVVLSENSQPLTFKNDGEWPWTVEDGYIQNSNYGTKYSGSTFSTTFKIDKPSKFSFEQWVNRYDSNTNNASSYHRLKFYINGEHYISQYYTNGWGKRQVLLEPGEYTIVLSDTIYDTTTAYYSRIRNMELSSNWLEVELASPGTLGVEVLYMVDVLTDVELLKVKGTLNATDWTNIKQMTNLLALDLSEAKFNALPSYAFDGLSWLSSVVLPEGMTTIGEYAFRGTQIWKIAIPSTVTSIGQYAFANTRLSEITFPGNSVLNTIGYAAFYQCTSLKEFIMPNTVKTLKTGSSYGYYYDNNGNSYSCYYCETFLGCTSLKKLHFSDSLTVINCKTCYNCTSLTELKLPANLKRIYPYAFYNNSHLYSIKFPENLTKIDQYAFYGCGNLHKTSFAENLRTIEMYAFENCGIDSLRLPVKLSSLGEYAFINCDNMTYIELPSYIGSYNRNFDGCGAIQKVVCQSATPPSISNDPFVNARAKSAITLVVPSFAVVNYKLDTYWYQFGSITEGDDIDYWKITSALSLTNNRRMNGKPDIDLYYGGRFTVGGNAPMETKQLNLFINESNPGRLLNTCENFTADSINTYFEVAANTWYFFTPLHDVDLMKVAHSANASFVFRYYDAASRATNGTGYSWKNENTGKLLAGQGYIFQCNAAGTVTMPAEATVHGQVLNTSDVTMTLSVHESTSSANKNWNYVGNPYPAYYDIYYMDFTAPVTVWTGSTYKAYSIADDNLVLRPMQSFFVQKPDAVDQIIFHKEGRQLTSTIERASYAPSRAPQNKADRFFFDIQIINEDSLLDETRVVLNEAASANYELSVDASKFMSMHAAVPQIFTLDAEGNGYAINERPAADGAVALAYSTQQAAFYTISATRTDGEVWLYDNETGKSVNLSEQDYTFYSEAMTDVNTTRFTLKLKAEEREGTGIAEQYAAANVTVAGQQDCLHITAPEGSAYTIYSIDGRKAGQGIVRSNDTAVALPAGTYVVKVANSVFKTTVF